MVPVRAQKSAFQSFQKLKVQGLKEDNAKEPHTIQSFDSTAEKKATQHAMKDQAVDNRGDIHIA